MLWVALVSLLLQVGQAFYESNTAIVPLTSSNFDANVYGSEVGALRPTYQKKEEKRGGREGGGSRR